MNPLVNSAFIVLLGAGLSFLAARYWYQRNTVAAAEAKKLADELVIAKRLADELITAKRVVDDERREMNKRVAELEMQLSAVKQSVLPISAAFQAILIKELTHFHTPRMDELMEKLGPPVTLTEVEQDELAEALKQRAKDMNGRISDSERDAALMLPMVMKRVLNESVADDPVKLGIVTTPVKPSHET